MKKIILFAFSALLFLPTFSQVLFTEDFSYGATAGSLDSTGLTASTIWKVHNGTASSVVYLPTGLSFTGYTNSAVGGAVSLQHGSGSRKDFNVAVPEVNSGSAYLSFILDVSSGGGATGDYMVHYADTSGVSGVSNLRGRIFIKDGTAGNFVVGLSKAGAAAAAVWSGDFPVNTPVVVVLKYVLVAGASNDSVCAWIFNGAIPVIEPTPHLIATDISGADISKIKSVCLRQGSIGTAAMKLDGFRFATSWNDAPLPVKYKSITLNNNQLKWSTASEVNNYGFEIWRSNNNGRYENIALVKGAGNSNVINKYAFTDVAAPAGNNCYKLKQIDFNGNAEFSKVLCASTTLPINNGMQVAPNPFSNQLNVTLHANGATTANVVVMDMLGNVHYQTTAPVENGKLKLTINTTDFANGIYFVRATANNQTYTQKLVKN